MVLRNIETATVFIANCATSLVAALVVYTSAHKIRYANVTLFPPQYLCNSNKRVIWSFMQDLGKLLKLIRIFVLATFVCLAAYNWPPYHSRSDHHVSNPHRPDYYCIQAVMEDPQCSSESDRSQVVGRTKKN